MDVCTIIAKNYIAYARVLARSFAEHHPDGRFYVLIIDELDGRIRPAGEPFQVVSPHELEIDGFEQMAVLYDVLELSTAVKPWLMRWLLARSPDGIAVYLDPDMRLYAPLDEMFAAVSKHGLVLSPHSLDPMPRDGKRPNEQDILIAGANNLGFIGIGSGEFADTLLHWWAERLETDCIVDPARGFFVDQRWIDLVPGMADSFHLLRDRGFNVAYWNLPARMISRAPDGTWLAGSVPLRLFHFSGFDPEHPHLLSKHQNRVSLADHADLAELCRMYADELIAQGAIEARSWPYTYAATASGMPLNAVVRNVYRKLVAAGEAEGSVFEPAGEQTFLEQLNTHVPESAGGAAGVTRYLAALHEDREDLRRAYPDLAGADGAAFVGWTRVYGKGEVPSALRPPPGADPARRIPPRPFGVNVAGYLNSELGVGEVARQLISALDAFGMPVLPVGIAAPASRQGHAFTHRTASRGGYPINIVCVNADVLPAFARGIGPEFFKDRHTVGWWWWELSEFPERWLGAFDHVDELWAGSRFVTQALAAVSPVPVLHMPVPVTIAGAPRADRRRFGLPAQFIFLFSFDYSSVLARKNPIGCIDAFLRAFPEPGEAVLVLKSINGTRHTAEHDRLRLAAAGHPHIVMLDEYLSPTDKDRLTATCDAYVSLHRSEGFGITMAEAMHLGKPVIATGYSGNLDFMTPDNSYLVDHKLIPIGRGADPYPADARWADPDLNHAAALMREVYEDREGAGRRAQRGAAEIREAHSVTAAGTKMTRRLDSIMSRVPPQKDRWEIAAAQQRLENASELLRSGPPAPSGGRGGRPLRLARRVALRILRPQTAHQRLVDRELVDALRALGRDFRALAEREAELTRRGMTLEAVALRGLRDVEHRLRGLLEPEITSGATRIDELEARVARHDQLMVIVPDEKGAEPPPDRYPAAPQQPWSEAYNVAHAAFVGRALDDAELIGRMASGGSLPAGFGHGFDERVVEFPWLASRQPAGNVLDAGSTLNHLHVLLRLRPLMKDLTIVTLAPEERAFHALDVSYVYADLRKLPLRDDLFDRIVSISTLEHVGLDNSHFGANGQRGEDPQQETLAAATELRRVLQPKGEILLTVPVGLPERFPWVRSFSLDELDALVERFDPVAFEVDFFRHDGGWQRADRASVADARYRDHLAGGEPRMGIVAAEAVACVALTIG